MSIAIDYSNTAKTKVVETTPIHTKDGGSHLVVLNIEQGDTPEKIGFLDNVVPEFILGGANNRFLDGTADNVLWGVYTETSAPNELMIKFGEVGGLQYNGVTSFDIVMYYNNKCASAPATCNLSWSGEDMAYMGTITYGDPEYDLMVVGDTLAVEFKF